MPALPSWAQAWLQARESSDAALVLLTITHPEWGDPVRLVRNTEDVTSRGYTYSRAPFDVDVVTDDDQPPRATLTVPNVDRSIGELCLSLSSPPLVAIEVISTAYPDEPIYRAARLELRNVRIDPLSVSGDLAVRDYSQEICGIIVMTPARAPALFRRKR